MENVLDQIFYNVNYDWDSVSSFLKNGIGGLSYVRHPIAQNVVERHINRMRYLFTEYEIVLMGAEMEGAKTESVIEFSKSKIEGDIKIPMHPSFDRFIDVLQKNQIPIFIDESEYLKRKIELGRFDKIPLLTLLQLGYCSDAEIDRIFTDFHELDGIVYVLWEIVKMDNSLEIISKIYDKIANFSYDELKSYKCTIVDIFEYKAFFVIDKDKDGSIFLEIKDKNGQSFWVHEYLRLNQDGKFKHYFLNEKILPLCS